ncbi:MAG: peroxidase [Acidimicrobiia bacterium]|nr:peroxidase [Acidimicrobiia bacterium]MDH3464234.1 peroxidase [Acidimicrobiia bacterium]
MTHHRRGLRRLLRDDELATRIEAGYEGVGLSEKRLAMLRFADKLTKAPGSMVESDIETLRSNGFSDLDILHITEVVAYFAYANRISDGLGIPLEDWIPEP